MHSVYQSIGELLETAHDIAATNDVPFHIHVSETRTENEDWQAKHGMTPTAWLDHLDVLDHWGVLAHAVHLTEGDRATIADSDAGIAHCASANLKLGSGSLTSQRWRTSPWDSELTAQPPSTASICFAKAERLHSRTNSVIQVPSPHSKFWT